jgi:transposase
MLHEEARGLLVDAFEDSHDAEGLAKIFKVSKSTVYRLAQQYRQDKSLELRTSKRGRKPKLGEDELRRIDAYLEKHPGDTIDELIAANDIKVSNETARRAVISRGWVRKRVDGRMIRVKR